MITKNTLDSVLTNSLNDFIENVQESLKMASNNVTSGLFDVVREIKGDHNKISTSLKDIIKEYEKPVLSDVVSVKNSNDKLINTIDDFLNNLKKKHNELFNVNVVDDKPVDLVNNKSVDNKVAQNKIKGDLNLYLNQLTAKLFDVYEHNEHIRMFFYDIDSKNYELHNFVPVLAYLCWNAWQKDELVELSKLMALVPSDTDIGPDAMFIFVQVAEHVYNKHMQYIKKII